MALNNTIFRSASFNLAPSIRGKSSTLDNNITCCCFTRFVTPLLKDFCLQNIGRLIKVIEAVWVVAWSSCWSFISLSWLAIIIATWGVARAFERRIFLFVLATVLLLTLAAAAASPVWILFFQLICWFSRAPNGGQHQWEEEHHRQQVCYNLQISRKQRQKHTTEEDEYEYEEAAVTWSNRCSEEPIHLLPLFGASQFKWAL